MLHLGHQCKLSLLTGNVTHSHSCHCILDCLSNNPVKKLLRKLKMDQLLGRARNRNLCLPGNITYNKLLIKLAHNFNKKHCVAN